MVSKSLIKHSSATITEIRKKVQIFYPSPCSCLRPDWSNGGIGCFYCKNIVFVPILKQDAAKMEVGLVGRFLVFVFCGTAFCIN